MRIAQIPISSYFNSPYGRGRGFADFASVILSNAVVFAGVIFFLLLVVGGITIIAGAGSGNKDDIAKGKKAVFSAIAGFLIIFTSYWIIVVAENIFGFAILNP